MVKLYFKVVRGYGDEDFIPIDETELEKAIYAHMSGKPVVFENGSINGNQISIIRPDFVRAMGWNRGYKPTPEEYGEIDSTIGRKYLGIIGSAKERVQGYIKSGELNKIGTTPLIENPVKKHTDGLTSLGNLLNN